MSTSEGAVSALSGGVRENLASRSPLGNVTEPIALVGMACRFPGGVFSPEELWELVSAGRDATAGLPEDRGWDLARLTGATADSAALTYSQRGGFIDGAADFDAKFFGIAPREALAMDPKQRLLLELSWEAVERAGIDPKSLSGSDTAVFTGLYHDNYGAAIHNDREGVAGHMITGNTLSVASGRISYFLGLEGPAISIDTACSSSLTALHLAAQALRSGECSLALVGGATVMSSPSALVGFAQLKALAADGRCKSFGERADGFGAAEGAGVVVAERLSDAVRHGRTILAVVRGSAVNQDGASNGLTAPRESSQRRVILQALVNAGLTSTDVDAVEAHGTGTTLGDLIEVQALMDTYGQGRTANNPLWLGSVKANIGHTQSAAGMASVIKMVYALRHATLPRTLHTETPNSQIDWGAGSVRLLTEPQLWSPSARPRRAGISSFGISGTNAHLILEEAPATAAPVDDNTAGTGGPGDAPITWSLSARTPAALTAQARRLGERLDSAPVDDTDVASTLARRSAFEHRAAVVGCTGAGLRAGLRALGEGKPHPAVHRDRAIRGEAVFVFPGQGSQWAGMGRELLAAGGPFRNKMTECASEIARFTGWDLVARLSDHSDGADFDRADFIQPALFAVMVSLAEEWRAAGVVPAAVIGHSQGEVAAAHVAGALTLADAARIVCERSTLITSLSGSGGMLSIPKPVDAVHALLLRTVAGGLHVAAINGPTSTVVSGPAAAIDELVCHCESADVDARRIPVDFASHSPAVDVFSTDIRRALAGITPVRGEAELYSTVHGHPVDGTELTADYWVENLRKPVQFAAAVREALDDGFRHFIEISPHPILVSGIEHTCAEASSRTVFVGATLKRDEGDALRLAQSVAAAHVAGVDIDLTAAISRGRLVDLPTYPFQRERYWRTPDSPSDPTAFGMRATDHPILGAVGERDDGGRLYSGTLDSANQPWIVDHQVSDTVVIPGAALLECVARAGIEVGCGYIREMVITEPLIVPDHQPVAVQVDVAPNSDGTRRVTIRSRIAADPGASWQRHADAVVSASPAASAGEDVMPPPDALFVDVSTLYERFAERGYRYGPTFQRVRQMWRRGDDLYAEISVPQPDPAGDGAAFVVHPAVLDATLHPIAVALSDADDSTVLLPYEWRGVAMRPVTGSTVNVRITRTADRRFAVTVSDGSGVLATVDALTLREAHAAPRRRSPRSLLTVDWRPLEVATVDQHADWTDITDETGDRPAALQVLRCVNDLDLRATPGADIGVLLRQRLCSVMARIQSWLATAAADPTTTLVVATCGAVAADGADGLAGLEHASVWGLVRSAQNEHPDRIRLLDIDHWDGLPEAVCAVAVSGETQLAVRRGRYLIPRLGRFNVANRITGGQLVAAPREQAWQLTAAVGGSLGGDNLVAAARPDMALADHEVRIAVHSVGVAFRDLLIALGNYPDPDTPLGTEGSGVVVEVGARVATVSIGDHVMGIFPGVGPILTADCRTIRRIPDGWSSIDAAGAVQSYLTAYHGLYDLAAVEAGDTVLIHAAAGGAGLAAVALAQLRGAEVFATAHPSKWSALIERGIKPGHLASSRDVTFEAAFREALHGKPIDVVMNSLTGDAIDASLRLMSNGGRFIELGRTDVREPETIATTYGVTYQTFTLPLLGPEALGDLLDDVTGLFERGALPPLPTSAWDVRRAPEVYRYMSQGRHLGRLVLSVPPALREDGTVLITGGTGTLGLLLAAHLVTQHGVTRLILASRSGGQDENGRAAVRELVDAGAHVDVVRCDAADRGAVQRLLDAIPDSHPLTAVVHAAGVLDDAMFADTTDEKIDEVLRPKVDAAWILHDLTCTLPLSAFVLFSSAAGQLGSPGQANYAAANAFLDALAQHRQHNGLPATSLAWGWWEASTGMTGHLGRRDHERMRRAGLTPLTAQQGLELFDIAVESGQPALTPMAVAEDKLPDPDVVPTLLRQLARRRPQTRDSDHDVVTNHETPALPAAFASRSEREQARILLDLVCSDAAAVLGYDDTDDIDADTAFRDCGFDSLSAVEFKNRLRASTGVALPVSIVFDHPTPRRLAEHLRVTLTDTALSTTSPEATPPGTVDSMLRTLDDLTDGLDGIDTASRREILVQLKRVEQRLRDGRAPDHSERGTGARDVVDSRR